MAEKKVIKTEPKEENKIFRVRTVHSCSANLCGYEFEFFKEKKQNNFGEIEKVGCVYELKSKDYLAKTGKDKVSVLPEIIKKLTNPRNKIVEIIDVQNI